ncbi:transposase [Microbispora sp. CA-135349]|uniref:transposase n=1 Tax=Microbispora sp. CA-135349 TaxID=3239953 RepID=UPI003D8D3C4F
MHALGQPGARRPRHGQVLHVDRLVIATEFPELARRYYRANTLWSGSHFAGSVGGAPISALKPYIEQHNRPV